MAETWFTPKEWKARLVEFAGRRLLRNVANGESTTYDVSRSEGQVSQEGDAFNTKNMNDLEQRISNGFAKAKTNIDSLNRDLGGLAFAQDANGNWGFKIGGADPVIPFKGEMDFDYEHNISIPYIVVAGNPNVLHYYTMTEEDAAYSYLALFAVTAGSVVSIELSGVSGPSIVCNKPGGNYSFALIANPVLNGKVNFRHGGTGDGHVFKLMIK
jgi:hypothetical protein